MRFLNLALVGTLALSSAGCAGVSGYPDDPLPSNTLKQLKDRYLSDTLITCYNKADCTAELGVTGKQPIRDDIIRNRLVIYDMEFADFERNLSGGRNTAVIASDLTSLVLTGLATTTGDASTKAALAAAAGGFQAANGVIDKDLFYQKTLPAVVTQMEANRETIEGTILAGLHKTDAEYPLAAANLDLVKLAKAGNLNEAITSLSKAASDAKESADAWIQAYRDTTVCHSDTCNKVRKWALASDSNLQKLADWADAHVPDKYKDIPMPESLVDTSSEVLEVLRAQAIKDLSIP